MGCIVVSVHDVAPPNLAAVRTLLSLLDRLGVRPRVLKVVPNFAGRWPLAESPELVRLLQAEVRSGSEVVLHGYTHRTAGSLQARWPTRLRARWFAAQDAEFLSLSPDEAERRLRAGLEQLRTVGLQAEGFCAPGWLAPAWLGPLLRALGFGYHVTMGSVHDLATGRRLLAPWFGSVGTGGLHEFLVHVGGTLGAGAARTPYPLVKVFFHPQSPRTWGPQLARLRRALRTRQVTTYRALLHG
ncbi:hypothetical protein HRbin32_01221 [bacterium HR32]|nr:hypothetical protein HRbin32_01221 [bacterium HR32]